MDDVHQDRDVRFHAADAEFAQAAVHAVERLSVRARRDRQLDEHGVVIRRDDSAVDAEGAIEAHPESAGASIGEDFAKIRRKSVFWILGGDPALDGITGFFDVGLLRQSKGFVVQGVALGNENLAAHDVDARHFFRDGMLDLNPWIHLDEIPSA